MTSVVVSLVTKTVAKADLPPESDVSIPFLYELRNTADEVVMTQKSTGKFVSFENVPSGDYIAVVSRFGFTATAPFSVKGSDEKVEVPDTVSVSVV